MQTFLKECRWGTFLLLRGDMISQYVDLYGEWCEREVDLFSRLLGDGDNVIEVGANIGLHAVPLAKLVGTGRVLCFEPQRLIQQVLAANCALNKLTNVHTIHSAVGDRCEEIEIAAGDLDQPWNYGAFSIEGGYGNHGQYQGRQWSERVALTTLDAHPDVAALKSLRLLKIDVEGLELAVLRGAAETIAQHRPVLFVENNDEATGDDLIAAVRELGYQPHWYCVERFSGDNFNQVSWQVPGGDFNMVCFPSEGDDDPGDLPPAQAFADLKDGKVGWVAAGS